MRGINFHDDWGWSNAPRIVGAGTAILAGSALGAGSSLIGSGKSSSAAKSAVGQSTFATELGILNQQQMYGQNVGRMQPFVNAGYGAIGPMQDLAGGTPWGTGGAIAADMYRQQAGSYLDQAAAIRPPSVVTENWLQQTPGYQWQLGQGLKAVQASNAARGLGVSGASLKGAATYATGLADANYQAQFNNAQTAWQDMLNQGASAQNLGTLSLQQAQQAQQMQQQRYGQYQNLGNLGENAAAGVGQAGTASANAVTTGLATGAGQVGNYLTQAGQAQATGTSGVSSAINQGINNYYGYQAYQNSLQGSQSGGWGTYDFSAGPGARSA